MVIKETDGEIYDPRYERVHFGCELTNGRCTETRDCKDVDESELPNMLARCPHRTKHKMRMIPKGGNKWF